MTRAACRVWGRWIIRRRNRFFAAVIGHAFGGDREPFRQQLIRAIAAEAGRLYWESWTAALEALVPTLPERSAP